MWLCFTLGVFQLIALVMFYYVTTEMDQTSIGQYLTPQLIQIGIFNMSTYTAYFLIVLFKAIKYTPSKVWIVSKASWFIYFLIFSQIENYWNPPKKL